MNDNYYNFCRICLKCDNVKLSNTFLIMEFIRQILGLNDIPEEVHLCLWCRAAIKRTTTLISIARKSQKLLLEHNEIHKDLQKNLKGVYEFNHFCNTPVNIIPNETNTIDNNCSKINSNQGECLVTLDNLKIEPDDYGTDFSEETETIQHQQEENVNNLCTDNRENEMKLKKKLSGKNKQCVYDEMQYDVEYLNLEQQIMDMEQKRKTEKYSRMEFKCYSCGIGFLTDDVYKEHELKHKEAAGPHKCKICDLRFKSQHVLSQHSLAHRRKFTCRICKNTYKRWYHCIAHRYKCGSAIEYVACETCHKIFSDRHSYKIHAKRVHNNEKKYHCNECDHKFTSKQRLTIHMRTHTGLKLFACKQCSKKFTTNSSLISHRSTHIETKKFYCVECDTRYKTKKGLRRHLAEAVRHAVTEDTVFYCPDCNKTFPTKKQLYGHINSRHTKSFKCDLCSKIFSTNTNLRKHKRCVHSTF
ncbi:zinc finger protein 615-like [Achroia grisella]|uniref:zinc finger protein 615-like n=1 Tax=Achroia grisella TaxID=688607 RepID=UPI0027D2A598|nr:zinc finger protein 615-like [Achroia grisella]